MFALEARQFEGAPDFGVFGEPFPDESAAVVFSHEQRDADVDAEHVAIGPSVGGMKGVHEAETAVDAVAEAFAHGSERVDAFAGRERDRTSGRAGHHGAVDPPIGLAAIQGRAAPIHVPVGTVRGR